MKIAIAGAGKLGLRIIEVLKGGDHSITVIDKDEELVKRLAATFDIATACGNAKEVSLLEDIGIADFDYFIATTDRDEKNIVIGTAAKRLGVPVVIVRIRDPEHERQSDFLKETFGIDYIVNPERSIAEEINKYLIEKYSLRGGILNAGGISMLEIKAYKRPELIGFTAKQAREILRQEGMSLAAISKKGKMVIPGADDKSSIIEEDDDELYVVGNHDLIESAAEKYVDTEQYTGIQRVMIAGGGKVGFYLARMLEECGASVKIIESDKQRCQYLSTHLQNVLILNGDASDIGLLEEENFSDMDAFVSATGFDEENILLALMAKQAGVPDVIAKRSRESFGELISDMGVDMVLNPVDISASHIVRNIKGATVLSSYIIQGQAELVHIAVDHDMSARGKEIRKLKLPNGLAIVAVQRGDAIILPDDGTKVMEGDHIVILSLLSESFDLEKLLKMKQGFFG